ncbi:MAG: winged helix-turn-helix transcriptional regulator [Spirochaetaceae bacterium]|jgi:DNA-binding MarR family transcriptional regulator|nr:winged helix-turn-helix transcriptional regulator [Spirochaetaceae bacterium]
MNSYPSDTEYLILEKVYDSSESRSSLSQRDLAQMAGTSLGMTNVILKRLARKGWIIVKKINSRNIQYAVTLDGMNEIIRRSYAYFKRTIKNVFFYKEKIDQAIGEAKRKGIVSALLVGPSDLDFIVEHSCRRHGLKFLQTPEEDGAPLSVEDATLRVYAETLPSIGGGSENALFLSRLALEKTPELISAMV